MTNWLLRTLFARRRRPALAARDDGIALGVECAWLSAADRELLGQTR